MSEKQARRRRRGEGTIETVQTKDGVRYRARFTTETGKKISLPLVDSPELAEGMRVEFLAQLATGDVVPVEGMTLRDFVEPWLKRLKELGKPRAKVYDVVWRNRVGRSPLADKRLVDITRRDVREYFEKLVLTTIIGRDKKTKKRIAPATVLTTRTMLSAALTAAVEAEIIPTNVMRKLTVVMPESGDEGEEACDYLRPHEQQALYACEQIPLADRLIIQFYIGTGLRAREGVFMPLKDAENALRTGQLFVRFGSKGRKPKGPNGGKTRTIPLLPVARDALKRWLELLPTYCPENPLGLAFPTARGTYRQGAEILGRHKGGTRWHHYLTLAGIDRKLVWHGLRHTTGASLASGWWGRPWKMDEIRDLLGHATIGVTEKYYGHLDPAALTEAAQQTTGGLPVRDQSGPTAPTPAAIAYVSGQIETGEVTRARCTARAPRW